MITSILQHNPIYLEPDQNRAAITALTENPSTTGGLDADLVVLPELFASGYFFRSTDDAAAVAESVPDGPTTRWLEAWSKASGTTIVAGDGTLYNSAVVVTPRGWLGTYRKVHLFYEEKEHFAPGDLGFPVFTVADRRGDTYRLGVMICFDWYFPEAARSLALGGADVIAHPANLVRPDCPRSMPIRALENHIFTATANRIGAESNGRETLTFIGQSLICSPEGQVLAAAGREDIGPVSAEIDPGRARDRQLTPRNHLFHDRRPDAYALGG